MVDVAWLMVEAHDVKQRVVTRELKLVDVVYGMEEVGDVEQRVATR